MDFGGIITGNKIRIIPKKNYEDKNIKNLYDCAFKILPSPAKTKINKSELDRGGGGVYTNRRSRFGPVIVTLNSFTNHYNSDPILLDKNFLAGWRLLCKPEEYFSNLELLTGLSLIVRYKFYDELKIFPAPVEWDKISSNRHDYKKEDIMWVQDIKNLDKFGREGKSIYIGPKLIGQNEMDYATKSEIENVKYVMLYQMTKMEDFKEHLTDSQIDVCNKFQTEFEKSKLFLENERLQEYSSRYGKTVCPEMIKCGDIKLATIKFKDIIHGAIEGDIGREDFNRTTTKINLHHVDKLLPGKLNHNHKNVFLGTAAGNTINSAFSCINTDLTDLIENIKKEYAAELKKENAELKAKLALLENK